MITAIVNDVVVDAYHSSGKVIQQVGWKVLDFQTAGRKGEEEQALPTGLTPRQPQDVLDVESLKKKTRAPKRLTEATLLTAMETAGKRLMKKSCRMP